MTFDLHHSWVDQRLAFNDKNLMNISLTLDNRVAEKIWAS